MIRYFMQSCYNIYTKKNHKLQRKRQGLINNQPAIGRRRQRKNDSESINLQYHGTSVS